MWTGYTDERGLTERVYTQKPEKLALTFHKEEDKDV